MGICWAALSAGHTIPDCIIIFNGKDCIWERHGCLSAKRWVKKKLLSLLVVWRHPRHTYCEKISQGCTLYAGNITNIQDITRYAGRSGFRSCTMDLMESVREKKKLRAGVMKKKKSHSTKKWCN